MSISAVSGTSVGAYQRMNAVGGATGASGAPKTPSPAESSNGVNEPPKAAREDRVTLSAGAVQKPGVYEKMRPETRVAQSDAAAAQAGQARTQTALDALRQQSRVVAQDVGGVASSRLHVVA